MVPFSAQTEISLIICKICKEINPNITVVLGGPDPTVRYKTFLKEKCCDFCVVGEGEHTFFEFVKKFNSKISLRTIKGLAYKEDNRIHYKKRKFIENLDALPFPSYELINVEEYLKNEYLYINQSYIPKNSISIITSRGCPYNCIFCSVRLHMGKKFRYNSSDYVIKHLKLLKGRYGITNFHFVDDNFSLNKDRFAEILDKIIDNKLEINWDVPNGIRADTLNYSLLKKLKKSGCKHLTIAIESGNQDVLNNIIKKNSSLEYMKKVVKFCKKLRIKTYACYVIGFPKETIKNMKETMNLALELLDKYDVIPKMFFATPLYGTELYDICFKESLINKHLNDKDFSIATQIYGNPMISTHNFSKEDIKKLIRDINLRLKILLVKYYIKHPFCFIERFITFLTALKIQIK